MKCARLMVTGITLLLLAAACGGGSSGTGPSPRPPPPPPLPAEPVVEIDVGLKQLVFSWAEIAGADYYRLLENPDGHSGFTQLGDNIPAGQTSVTRDIAVHLFDFAEALYVVEACNVSGCTGSPEVSTAIPMLSTIGYFKASNTDPEDMFGGNTWIDNWGLYGSVALSADGQTLAVGAPQEQSSATGIDGDQADNSSDFSGAVYVFRNSPTGWFQQAYIKGSGEPFEVFGSRVDLSGDGNTLVVDSHVYRFADDAWAEQQVNTDISRCDFWPVSVDVSEDGLTMVRGNPIDANYRIGVGGTTEPIPPPLYEESPLSGAVCVFRFDGAAWKDEVYIKPSDTHDGMRFGSTVELSADGTTFVVGAPYAEGAVYLFRFDGESWFEQAKLRGIDVESNDFFGSAVALDANGDRIAVGAPGHHWVQDGGIEDGAVYVFDFDGNQWIERALIKPGHLDLREKFGESIAFDASGDLLAIGASGDDSAAVGVDGDMLDDTAGGAGAVYLFRFESGAWTRSCYVKASNAQAGDAFGRVVSLSADGMSLAASAPNEDSAATGVGSDQFDNSAPGAGAVYLY